MATRGRKAVDHSDIKPKPPEGKPTMPSWLDAKAKAEWKRIVPLLDQMGVISKVDGSLIAVYCQSFSRWRQAEENVKKDGMTIIGSNGFEQVNPQIKIANESIEKMTAAMEKLGMTPTSRKKIEAIPKTPKEIKKWDDIIRVAS